MAGSFDEVGGVTIPEFFWTLSNLHPVIKMRGIAFERKEDFSYSRKLPERILHLSKEIRTAATGREVTYVRCSCQIPQVHVGTSVLDVYTDEKRFRVFRKV